MQEAFLYYLWKYRLFESHKLKTCNSEELEILNPGQRNDDSGPDFFNARIRIAGFLWAGNVEVHVKASDWNKHGHTSDKAFDNIILHVVHEADTIIKRADGSIIPMLELKDLYAVETWQHYLDLIQGTSKWIPCERSFMDVPEINRNQWFDRLISERLEERSSSIELLLKQTKNNWEESFYRHLAKHFGFRVNNVPFDLLATSLPLSFIGKHRNQLLQIEALLFGQAGFLENDQSDYYIDELKKEFIFLKSKFGLQPLSVHLWKFGRLRPANFPTIRIAQFANLYWQNDRLFNTLIHAESFAALYEILNVSTSGYWNRHYNFKSHSEYSEKKLGRSSIESLLINSIIPFTFYYGKYQQQEYLSVKALSWLEKCKPENNTVMRGWESLGIKIKDAAVSQALLQQKKLYCDFKKCVNCGIGQYLLQR